MWSLVAKAARMTQDFASLLKTANTKAFPVEIIGEMYSVKEKKSITKYYSDALLF